MVNGGRDLPPFQLAVPTVILPRVPAAVYPGGRDRVS
jgi:hypothetical protein